MSSLQRPDPPRTLAEATAVLALLNPQPGMPLAELGEAVAAVAKYALTVGAASAAVGIFVGAINVTGVGIRLGFTVTSGAAIIAEAMRAEGTTAYIASFSGDAIASDYRD